MVREARGAILNPGAQISKARAEFMPPGAQYSKTSLNRTLLFQKVVRFSKISVYTKCRIAPANRTKFGLGGGFSDVSDP